MGELADDVAGERELLLQPDRRLGVRENGGLDAGARQAAVLGHAVLPRDLHHDVRADRSEHGQPGRKSRLRVHTTGSVWAR
ncbi:hypothetical protein GCM10010411_01750 [Actinomadura fulvescens]|uniref:Uncharacterized protein n=1 Tax=Actinomadura fulvescens TaxID=46160 RepID=A0ABN3P9L4_9ACTN